MNPATPKVELALRDIHLPDSILWWPLAPGWWMLIVLVVIVALSIFVYKKTYYNRKLNKNIKLELAQHFNQYKNDHNAQQFIKQVSALLRRVSLYKFKQESVAKLHGTAWLEFLDSKLPQQKIIENEKMSFKSGVGTILLSGPYQANITDDVTPVHELVKHWLKYNLKNQYGLR